MNRRLAERLADLAGSGAEVISSSPVGGGCISDARRVDFSTGETRFVKTHSTAESDLFEREAEGLEALAGVGTIRVPAGAIAGEAGGERFIAMEWIETGAPGAAFATVFGRRFADLHRASASERCGFAHDNYIGATSQRNEWTRDWIEFYGRHRLGFQLDLARRSGLSSSELDRLGDRLLDRLGDWLEVPGEPACLLHGDLWGGNFMVDAAGEPVLIDPACYYGHREADLAMTRLFGGFGPGFYAAYEEAWPLPEGSEARTEIYKLYHLLNHLNLFGGSYRGQCVSLLKGLV